MLNIQTLASSSFFGTFALSEMAAWQLDAYPTSVLAWQLNLGALHAFERARVGMQASACIFSPLSLPAVVGLLLVIIAVRQLKFQFAVALFANMSFIGSMMLSYAVFRERPSYKPAPTLEGLTADPQSILAAALLFVSFIGFAVSHWSFVSAIFDAPIRRPVRTPEIA